MSRAERVTIETTKPSSIRPTKELSDAGGPARPRWQRTLPARVRSSDLVGTLIVTSGPRDHDYSGSKEHCGDHKLGANANREESGSFVSFDFATTTCVTIAPPELITGPRAHAYAQGQDPSCSQNIILQRHLCAGRCN